jgi:hypothetical protein
VAAPSPVHGPKYSYTYLAHLDGKEITLLLAHLVPGYFAAVGTQPHWNAEWTRLQRRGLWAAALVSSFAPDFDVIYNTLFRGFVNHSFLWIHSIFLHGSIALAWWVAHRSKRFHYLAMLLGLIAFGGLSHLFLDVISHGTPLFYPLDMTVIGAPSTRVVLGGVRGYLTDPIFLLEPLLIATALAHWAYTHLRAHVRLLALIVVINGTVVFVAVYVALLPILQHAVPVP